MYICCLFFFFFSPPPPPPPPPKKKKKIPLNDKTSPKKINTACLIFEVCFIFAMKRMPVNKDKY